LQFTSDWSYPDFFIPPTHLNCDRVLRGEVVTVIKRPGVPIRIEYAHELWWQFEFDATGHAPCVRCPA
jgi:hypothetical protein